MPADRVDIFFLADSFGGDTGLALVRHDAVADQSLEGGNALVFHDAQRMGKLAVAHR